jgi:adenosylcobinamide kinase / adenosylcobinamide-phosphate guanylyltransferase
MKLIIGGVAQGKLEVAKKLMNKGSWEEDLQNRSKTMIIIDENYNLIEELYTANIINHYHLIIKRLLQEKQEPELIMEELINKNPKVCIVTTEIGYGIVPMDSFEREYRERTGRICCKVAAKADEVYRVICGIAERIK